MSVTFTTIDFPGAEWTEANGINRHGPLGRSVQVVGTFADGSGTHGFLYSHGQYTRIDFPDGHNTEAYGINGRSQIVGLYRKSPYPPLSDPPRECQAFILDSGTYQTIDTTLYPAGIFGEAAIYGKNNSGAIVGSYYSVGKVAAYGCTSPDPYAECGVEAPSPGSAQLYGINSAGHAVGTELIGTSGSGQTARGIYTHSPNSGTSGLADLPGASSTYYRGINDNEIICGYADFGNSQVGFVVSTGPGFTVFQFPGANRTQVHGINNPIPDVADTSFQVVGSYTSTSHIQRRGFMATLSPPHLVKWDGRDFIEQELAEGMVFRVDGQIVPAGQQSPEPKD
jgi:hypothetical protein